MDAHNAGVGTFPLLLATEGQQVRIVAFRHGRDTNRKLADLGLAVGSEVTVISSIPGGQMIIARDDMRIALGTGIAHRVLVAPMPGEDL